MDGNSTDRGRRGRPQTALRRSLDAFPSECGSLPVPRGIVNDCTQIACSVWALDHSSRRGRGSENIICAVPEICRPNLRVRLKRAFLATILTIVGTAVLAFGVDYAIFRVRVAAHWNPYGSVTVDHYYAVQQKNGKTKFIFDPPASQTCVHSLFPHAGWLPCWYLSRHPEQRTDI